MPLRHLTLGFLAAALLTAGHGASAADLDENYGYADQMPAPPVIAETKVEFGTGWYVRGDLAATAVPSVASTNAQYQTYGGVAYDYPPSLLFSRGHDAGYTASLGFGYAFLNNFRADVVADFHKPLSSVGDGTPFRCPNGYGLTPATDTTPESSYLTYGSCTGHFRADLHSYDVLVNGYYDFGHWYGLTPYVGAGVGLAFGHYATSSAYTQDDATSYNIVITDPVSGSSYHIYKDRSTGGSFYNFAFALMAGVSYDIFPHTKLDVGYRYLNSGRVYGLSLYEHEVRAGLRYMIDN